jgi:hypothetical protein
VEAAPPAFLTVLPQRAFPEAGAPGRLSVVVIKILTNGAVTILDDPARKVGVAAPLAGGFGAKVGM